MKCKRCLQYCATVEVLVGERIHQDRVMRALFSEVREALLE